MPQQIYSDLMPNTPLLLAGVGMRKKNILFVDLDIYLIFSVDVEEHMTFFLRLTGLVETILEPNNFFLFQGIRLLQVNGDKPTSPLTEEIDNIKDRYLIEKELCESQGESGKYIDLLVRGLQYLTTIKHFDVYQNCFCWRQVGFNILILDCLYSSFLCFFFL
jgi:hypothetical protein